MNVIELTKTLITSPEVVVLGVLTLVEVAPIKINPWKTLLEWAGSVINAEFHRDLLEMKTDFENHKANEMRWNILNFANSCRRGEEHGKDEWRHVVSQIAEYEEYTETKEIINGVIDEDSRYLRELYMRRNQKNDFLR